MTELEALNMLLRAIGQRAVVDIDSTLPSAENARDTLNRIRGTAQGRGWWFNLDYNVVYTPDEVSGHIELPSQIRTVRTETSDIIKRGNKLYDRYNQTFIFTAPVCVVREQRTVDWDDMPADMQVYVAHRAAADFISDELEDAAKEERHNGLAGLALVEVKKQDLEANRYNVFNTPRVFMARRGQRPYNRSSSSRFTGTPDK
tara:strand:+ start:959 stop:1564 length:606 start_codon:yes stop_codon:yes gene_type:complete